MILDIRSTIARAVYNQFANPPDLGLFSRVSPCTRLRYDESRRLFELKSNVSPYAGVVQRIKHLYLNAFSLFHSAGRALRFEFASKDRISGVVRSFSIHGETTIVNSPLSGWISP